MYTFFSIIRCCSVFFILLLFNCILVYFSFQILNFEVFRFQRFHFIRARMRVCVCDIFRLLFIRIWYREHRFTYRYFSLPLSIIIQCDSWISIFFCVLFVKWDHRFLLDSRACSYFGLFCFVFTFAKINSMKYQYRNFKFYIPLQTK